MLNEATSRQNGRFTGSFKTRKLGRNPSLSIYNESDSELTDYFMSESDDEIVWPQKQAHEYAIERIVNQKCEKGVNMYKVKWKGYPKDLSTWEKEENLHNCVEYIQEFESNLQKATLKREIFKIKVDELDRNKVTLMWKEHQKNLDSEVVNLEKDLYIEDIRDDNVSDLSEETLEDSIYDDGSDSHKSDDSIASSHGSSDKENPDILVPIRRLGNNLKIRSTNQEAKYKTRIEVQKVRKQTQKMMFFEGAIPLKIVSQKYRGKHPHFGIMVDLLVKWRKPSGAAKRPKQTYYSNTQLRVVAPELLAEYYKSSFLKELEVRKKALRVSSVRQETSSIPVKSKKADTKRVLGLIPQDLPHKLNPISNSVINIQDQVFDKASLIESKPTSLNLIQPKNRKAIKKMKNPEKEIVHQSETVDLSKFTFANSNGFAGYMFKNIKPTIETKQQAKDDEIFVDD